MQDRKLAIIIIITTTIISIVGRFILIRLCVIRVIGMTLELS